MHQGCTRQTRPLTFSRGCERCAVNPKQGCTCIAAVQGPQEEGTLLAMQEMSGNPQYPHKKSHGSKAAAHLQRPGLRIHGCRARALGPGLLPGCRPPLQLPQLQHLLLHSALHSTALSAAASSAAPFVLKLDVAGSQAIV